MDDLANLDNATLDVENLQNISANILDLLSFHHPNSHQLTASKFHFCYCPQTFFVGRYSRTIGATQIPISNLLKQFCSSI